MGFLLNKNKVASVDKLSIGKSKSVTKSDFENVAIELYKPLTEFGWKDATKRERKEIAIEAYKDFAF
jgi:hypothetical protein